MCWMINSTNNFLVFLTFVHRLFHWSMNSLTALWLWIKYGLTKVSGAIALAFYPDPQMVLYPVCLFAQRRWRIFRNQLKLFSFKNWFVIFLVFDSENRIITFPRNDHVEIYFIIETIKLSQAAYVKTYIVLADACMGEVEHRNWPNMSDPISHWDVGLGSMWM